MSDNLNHKVTVSSQVKNLSNLPCVENEYTREFDEILESQDFVSGDVAGKIVKGKIIAVNKKQGFVLVDLGLKAEASVDYSEFLVSDTSDVKEPEVGEEYEFYVVASESPKNFLHILKISRSRVMKEKVWLKIVEAKEKGDPVEGIIFKRMKGGFCIDFCGNFSFLPASQVKMNINTRGSELVGRKLPFKILDIDPKYKTCIASQTAVIDETLVDRRSEFIAGINEGDVIEGVVKSIINYGAFVELKDDIMDGLLHLTDISWKRISHPSEVISVGQKLKLKVIKADRELKRISLGLKQMTDNPNAFIQDKYTVGQEIESTVLSVIDGDDILVEIEQGVEGLIRKYDVDWTKEKSMAFASSCKPGTKINVKIIAININDNNKVLVSRKHIIPNPWSTFMSNNKAGNIIEAIVRRVESYRLLIGLEGGISGVVQMEDISWISNGEDLLKSFQEGQKVKVVYLSGTMDEKHPRINLSLKHLTESPIEKYKDKLQKDSTVESIIIASDQAGITVETFGLFTSFIKLSQMSTEKTDRTSDRFKIGSYVKSKVIDFNERNGELKLSIRRLEESEQDEILKSHSDNESQTISSVLGSVLKKIDE